MKVWKSKSVKVWRTAIQKSGKVWKFLKSDRPMTAHHPDNGKGCSGGRQGEMWSPRANDWHVPDYMCTITHWHMSDWSCFLVIGTHIWLTDWRFGHLVFFNCGKIIFTLYQYHLCVQQRALAFQVGVVLRRMSEGIRLRAIKTEKGFGQSFHALCK